MSNPTRRSEGWNARLVESYDVIAERYAEHRVGSLDRTALDTEVLDRFAGLVRERGRVCDLGCGAGVVARHLSAHGVDVFGIDVSPGMVAVARRNYPDILFQQGDMRALDLPDASIAGIVSFYSVLHIERPVVPRVLGEMARVLRPGGMALITVYIGEGEHHTDLWLEHEVAVETTLFRPGELEALIEAAGLTIEAAQVCDPLDFDFQKPRVHLLASRADAGRSSEFSS